ncbi:3-hydroxyisobutyryl-CoA hydrolase [Paramagnetospirillum magnetotacticum MS-1]|uniref:3-hydroxyisobutyryl-CoA hydrolase n=1 Tax=Paramagnetospirillum magnetotacticum MS-1 TaxID=272627 RepID=A0A0C2YWC3_PARME|nr:enoyl-CoA hydratase/isomerase family protein [Paramagnetospirillum magnetotacticum]KIL99000.1 3-hydroxyisobutyryl-CoA hydrolase [Paramagnetospirillum magnetotacticum MS-1]
MGEETRIDRSGRLGRIVLNRPKVLNALSATQYHQITDCLSQWEIDPDIAVILIEGEGDRAFCAGGDIRMVWDAARRGDHAFNLDVFRTEYRLNRRIHHYPKPYVSLLDGICMGGGAGLSVNGRYRIATERTRFAMPETGIGFFPDVGATHFLNRCPGSVGLYLGLTGRQLGPADCLWAGIATHFVPVERLDELHNALDAAALSSDPTDAVAATLSRFHQPPGDGPLLRHLDTLECCFAMGRLEDVVEGLRRDGGQWAWDTIWDLSGRAPLSLAVTHRQLREGKGMEFDEAISREFRLAWHFLAGHDFLEGIRALVVDKDRRPVWSPSSLAEVDELSVAAYFQMLGDDELPLP